MVEKRYKSRWLDQPLYVGTKTEMEGFMKSRGKSFSKTHSVKKIPTIKGGHNKYGVYRK